nr:hypothetical protein [Tanacetum cinerariifolium]
MDGSRVERESEGGMPLEKRAEDCRSQGVNLPPLLTAHLRRTENGQPKESTPTFVFDGHQPLTNSGGNLPSNSMYLLHNASPFIPNSLQPTSGHIFTYVNPYSQPNMEVAYEQPLSFFPQAQGGNSYFGGTSTYNPYIGYVPQAPTSNHVPTYNSFMHSSNAPSNSYPFYTQPINPLLNAPLYPNHVPTGLFPKSNGCVTPFICWIKDYPPPDGRKMASHMGSYDGKGDLDNYLHLFEDKKPCEIPLYRPPNYVQGSDGKTYTWIKAKEAATNGAPNDHRESFDRFKKGLSWDNNKGKKNRDKFSPYSGPNHGLFNNLCMSPREILATKKVAKTFKQPPRMIESRRSRDMSKYSYFHEDHEHDTNQFRELRHQIKEVMKSGQLAHLMNGIKKEKAKVSDTQLGE